VTTGSVKLLESFEQSSFNPKAALNTTAILTLLAVAGG
jgi:hypothetical protein